MAQEINGPSLIQITGANLALAAAGNYEPEGADIDRKVELIPGVFYQVTDATGGSCIVQAVSGSQLALAAVLVSDGSAGSYNLGTNTFTPAP